MVCHVYFFIPEFHNFIKGIMCIYVVFLKNLKRMSLYFTY